MRDDEDGDDDNNLSDLTTSGRCAEATCTLSLLTAP